MNQHELRPARETDGSAGVDGAIAGVDAVLGEMRAGRLLEAQSRCLQALAANSEEPELLHLMALMLDRDDSPWYPSVRLFRQTETREYGSVIGRVRAELEAAVVRTDENRRGQR